MKTTEIRKKIAARRRGASPEAAASGTQNRLSRLESEGRVAETIVHTYGPSICLLHVVVQFRDPDSGQLIHISADATGKPQVDDKGMVSLETAGTGPLLQLDVFGTGFLVARDGRLLTNHHVVDGAEDIKVELNNRRTYSAKMIGSDAPSDLAVLKISAGGLTVLHLGDSDKVRVGDVCGVSHAAQ